MPYVDPTIACSPYTTADKLCCATPAGGDASIDCDGASSPVAYSWSDDQLIDAATNLLFRRTCFRYPGVCTRTIIPCVCHQVLCLCSRYEPEIALTSEYPILSVTSVVENGVTLDPTAYRLDENARLVRLNDLRWSTDYRAIQITYTTGRDAPIEIQLAASELACELKKACSGDDSCSLPAHVKSVSRRGVQIEVNDVIAMMMSGLTGNPIIDYALTTHGGNCRKSVMFDALRDGRSELRVT